MRDLAGVNDARRPKAVEDDLDGRVPPRTAAPGQPGARTSAEQWLTGRVGIGTVTVLDDPFGRFRELSSRRADGAPAGHIALHPCLERSSDPAEVVRDALRVHQRVVVAWHFDVAPSDGIRPAELLATLGSVGSIVEVEAVDGALCATIARDGESIHVDLGALQERLVLQLGESVRRARHDVDRHRAVADELDERIRRERGHAVNRVSQIHAAHDRQMEALRNSARWRLGDALVNVAYQPKTILRLPSALRDVYRTGRANDRTYGGMRRERAADPRRALVVLASLDARTRRLFDPEARLVALDEANWRAQMRHKPAILMVDSCRTGDLSARSSKSAQIEGGLGAILQACRSRGIPSVLWHRPSSWSGRPTALERSFDLVIAGGADAEEGLARELGAERVVRLAGAAQPVLHNPIGARAAVVPRAGFADGWPTSDEDDHCLRLEALLDPLFDARLLDIYEPEAGAGLGFPMPYRAVVVGTLANDELTDTYKRHAVFLDVESQAPSTELATRRIFEILACATPVVTAPSRDVEELLGDVVVTANTARKMRDAVEALVSDPVKRDQMGQRGHRHVMNHHTCSRRFDEITHRLGLGGVSTRDPLVSIVCVSNRPEFLDHAIASIRRQRYANAEVIFVMNSSRFDRSEVYGRVAELNRSRVVDVSDDATLADCINEALEHAQGEYFAKFDDDDHYGANYLTDLMFAFEYADDAGIVGKRTCYAYMEGRDETVLRMPGREFSYVQMVAGGTIVADRRKCSGVSFTPVQRGTDTLFFEDLTTAGVRVFSADRFNFVQTRLSDLSRHTWRIPENQYLANCEPVGKGLAREVVYC